MNELSKSVAPPLFRGKPLQRVHVMVKPVGPRCNLDSTYCYYSLKEELAGGLQWLKEMLLAESVLDYLSLNS